MLLALLRHAAAAAADATGALCRALRLLPRRRPAGRHGAGAAAGEPRPAEAGRRGRRDRATAGRRRRCRASPARSRATEIAALAELIRTPLPEIPRWGRGGDRGLAHGAGRTRRALPDRPLWQADPLNLFVVVEAGDHHVTILDGDRFEPLARFPSRFALHGGPKFSPDGRFVHFMSRDGWVTRYDLWSLQPVAEVRAGINSRNIAISDDGRVIAVANYLPHTPGPARCRDSGAARGQDRRRHRSTRQTSRVSAVYQAAPRQSFVVALKDLPEIWEVSYATRTRPRPSRASSTAYEAGHGRGAGGAGAASRSGASPLAEPLDDFFFDPSYDNLIGSSRDGGKAVVVNLDVRREIAELPLPGLPHLGSGIALDLRRAAA